MTRIPFQIHVATQDHLPEITDLARRIWHQCYPGIISQEQIDYMLAHMYSEPTLARDLAQGVTYYRLLCGERAAGFAAAGPDACGNGEAWLHKLYVLEEHQGRGAGRALIEQACADAAAAGHHLMRLRVNRENTRAIRAYERCGFAIRETRCDDIGGGFVMDDYIMQRRL
ncbi:GNAT family N-acetyltransferase [Ectothiorhodospira mobilis]|uniref:GNAT family N-acetyltransferase n=1 Tax=Ectothiorhodospira mobilis TaxID=195064 RepID=UPI001907C658|nr:GNAT family N-acetyltransferase [Ectothiorhodospira mobilis]MBK1692556.1 hypothetical protein [Ectothiorhodospira mobilis]